MLAALAIVSLISLLAAQTLAGAADQYTRIRADHAQARDDTRIQAILTQAVARPLRSGPSAPEDLGLGLERNANGWRLNWQRPGLPIAGVDLAGQAWSLDLVRSDEGLLLALTDDEAGRVVASARRLETAPRNCRYDAIGRRCLESPA